ncbi:MAG: flagellar assembly protein FliX [Micavibrio sp. TMED27]|nr:flagellar assembly protein FliX [Micavibrio sp.]OUT91905.1 MAG: flagellar assembly protein FliX [Micavibrio sp. TMED27]|tara:strand:- start:577 stop:1041 length:465 start_codon:yes stop_codon:yes gene_type:complete
MKIQGPGQTQNTSKVKKKSDGGGSGEFGKMLSSSESSEAGATQTTQSIAHVDALLALQEADDPTARAAKKRMKERANDLLEGLEEIRNAMLTGQLTVGHMIDIADVVASHRERINDPTLTSVMDEIDLRAQVELAKMRVALDARKAKDATKPAS